MKTQQLSNLSSAALWNARFLWEMRTPVTSAILICLLILGSLILYGLTCWDDWKTSVQQSEKLQNNIIALAVSAKARKQSETDPLSIKTLDNYGVFSQKLEILRKLAEQHKILLSAAQYELQRHPDNLIVLRIHQDLAGNYPDIRTYLSTIQKTLNNLAIVGVTFQRPDIKREQINASASIMLYFSDGK